jgi:hypothetical protein
MTRKLGHDQRVPSTRPVLQRGNIGPQPFGRRPPVGPARAVFIADMRPCLLLTALPFVLSAASRICAPSGQSPRCTLQSLPHLCLSRILVSRLPGAQRSLHILHPIDCGFSFISSFLPQVLLCIRGTFGPFDVLSSRRATDYTSIPKNRPECLRLWLRNDATAAPLGMPDATAATVPQEYESHREPTDVDVLGRVHDGLAIAIRIPCLPRELSKRIGLLYNAHTCGDVVKQRDREVIRTRIEQVRQNDVQQRVPSVNPIAI